MLNFVRPIAASPFHFNVKDNVRDLLDPAVQGTTSIIDAIAKESNVKHLVITSSFASILDLSKGYAEGTTYTGAPLCLHRP